MSASPNNAGLSVDAAAREFLPGALSVTETPPAPLGRLILWMLCGFITLALIWAWVGRIDVVASAQGKVILAGRAKLLQPLESGVVRAILVRDGQRVKAGDLLVELDATLIDAERSTARRELVAATVELARLEALTSALAKGIADHPELAFAPPLGADPALVSRAKALLNARAEEARHRLIGLDGDLTRRAHEARSVEAQIAKLSSTLPIAQQRLEARQYLSDRQTGSVMLALEAKQQVLEMTGELAVLRSRRQELSSALDIARSGRAATEAEMRRQAETEKLEAERKVAALTQDLVKLDQRRRQMSLTAPEDGVVQQLAVNTVGGVVTPAQVLLIVVPTCGPKPDGQAASIADCAAPAIEVEAMIPNRDVGFIRVGQEVAVKLETFTFTRYGLITGKVTVLSGDAVEDPRQGPVYPARIALDRTSLMVEGRETPVTPGMAATVEIKTGERRLIDYVLTPLLKTTKEAMRER